MWRYACTLGVTCVVLSLCSFNFVFGQTVVAATEVEALKEEMRKIQQRINRLERTSTQEKNGAPVITPMALQAQARPGEREIQLEKEHPLEVIGLSKPEIAGARISGFFVGSASYNSHIQMVPEFAGGAPTLADPRRSNFRFDKFGLGVSKSFASWLSAAAAIEVESHRDRHTHIITTGTLGCPAGQSCERFGAEAASTEVTLDKFHLTAIAPLGNGIALSIGRFDIPFGIERHDEPLNLTATTSEVFQFGRPQRMTGFQTSYQFAPWLDVVAWAVNRWESETTHDPFDDNNTDKSFGGRVGITPFPQMHFLNFGVGGFVGPERADNNADHRWVIDGDVTWSPIARLLLAAEVIYGGEGRVSFRARGTPFAASAVTNADVNWWGLYLLAHYECAKWLGMTFRYGYFDDMDGARTGVEQVLQSWTFAPIIHLSRLIPDLRPTGAVYARSRQPIDWVNLKLEYRLNHSDVPVFSDSRASLAIRSADKTGHQLQLQAVVNF